MTETTIAGCARCDKRACCCGCFLRGAKRPTVAQREACRTQDCPPCPERPTKRQKAD